MQTPLPSVGRKVWFYADGAQKQPLDATITFIHDPDENGSGRSPDALVNLFVADGLGGTYSVAEVPCIQQGADRKHYRWMPYQLKQAARNQIDNDAQAAGAEERLNPERGQFEKATAEREQREAEGRKKAADPSVRETIDAERKAAPPIPAQAPTPTKTQPTVGKK